MSLEKIELTTSADRTSGTYVITDASILDVLNPSVALNDSAELIRLMSVALITYLVTR